MLPTKKLVAQESLTITKPIRSCFTDLKNPKTNTKTAGFTKEERADFTKLLNAGFIDTYRRLYPGKTEAYTFWTYMGNARAKNIGWYARVHMHHQSNSIS